MNFVPCVAWVKRGVAKSIPDKVQLTKAELEQLIQEAKDDLKESVAADNNDVIESDNEDFESRYNFDEYDNEDEAANPIGNLAQLTQFASNDQDPDMTVKDEDDESDDENDFEIKQTDNLIAVGHVEEDCSSLEVHVYNEQEEHLYIHHDIILPAYPLAMEWTDYDPSENVAGNYLAVSDMTPLIRIWDLDLVDTMEPVVILGEKARKKKKGVGHKDAVLCLSWNNLVRHGLASGSADNDIILWDLSESKVVSIISQHSEKVQSIRFHPCEGQMLLSGSSDKTINLYDCRSPDDKKSWIIEGEVENVIWNHFDPFYFLSGSDNGVVNYFDVRTKKPLYTLKAHDQAVTGIALSSSCKDCLVTVSDDKTVKIWDIENNQPALVAESNPKLGALFTLSASPDSPFVFAMGGDNRLDNFKVWDIRNNKAVRQRFKNRLASGQLDDTQSTSTLKAESNDNEEMETDALSGIEKLSLAEGGSTTQNEGQEKPHKKLPKRKTFSKTKHRKM